MVIWYRIVQDFKYIYIQLHYVIKTQTEKHVKMLPNVAALKIKNVLKNVFKSSN